MAPNDFLRRQHRLRPTRPRLRRSASGLSLALALVIGACAQTPSADVAGLPEATLQKVLEGSSWKRRDLQVRPWRDADAQTLLRPGAGCKLYSASNNAIVDGGVIEFALDERGELIAQPQHGGNAGLTQLLRRCMRADAVVWAKTIAMFTNAMLPTVVTADKRDDLATLTRAGVRDVPPTLQRQASGDEVRFVTVLPLSRYFRLKAFVPDEGPTVVEQDMLDVR